LRTYPSLHAYYARVGLGERRSQIGVFGWWADHPSGSALFPVLFTCDSYKPADLYNMNPAGFCHRRLDARIRRAGELEQVDPTAAARLWNRVDRRVTRAAPWAALVNQVGIDFVSERAGNYQRNPAFGVLLDRLWVK
jgi:ABC-type transport system substrate-binding protein